MYALLGFDELGLQYTIKAFEIAEQLGLFDPAVHSTIESQKERRVRELSAWALFSYDSLYRYMFCIPPLLHTPPPYPLPDPITSPKWYGELQVKYSMDTDNFSTYFSLLFKAKAEMCVIMNEISMCCFTESGIPTLSLKDLTSFNSRLESWFNSLPNSLHPHNIVLPGQIMLQ